MAPPLSQRPGVAGAVARFWQRSYAPDYVGFALLITAYILLQFFVEPFHQMFTLDDPRIQYPHALIERVPTTWMFIYAGAVPLATIVLWAVVFRPGFHQSHVTLLGFFISLAMTSFLTNVIKNAIGRPRPDLIDRCQPRNDTPLHSLVTFEVCTETDHHTLHDGFRSFPSGHSSFSFAGLGYLALLLAGQMHVFRPKCDLARVVVAFAPLIGAALIAISRLEDYRHGVYDVTTGSLLGMLLAYFSYRRFYPKLTDAHCQEALKSRVDYVKTNPGARPRDEEAHRSSSGAFSLDDLDEDSEDCEAQPLTDNQDMERTGQR